MRRVALVALVLFAGVAAAQRRVRVLVPETAVAPGVPAAEQNADFPVRVHLLTARWGGLSGAYHGYGSGNLLDAKGEQGFDYGFECSAPFVANQSADETYQARWKGAFKLEILTAEVGREQPREHACTLRLAMRERPFEPEDTAALSHGVSSSLRKRWQDPDFAFEAPRQDYPIQFHVVDGERQEDMEGDHGSGTANLTEAGPQGPVHGAEYRYTCWYGFLLNTQISGFYQGRWITPGSELEVLLQRPGSDKVDRCKVEVDMKLQPYAENRRTVARASESAGPEMARPQ
jgi:hypothetical protein